MFNGDDESNPNLPPSDGGKTYQFEDQVFSEVIVDETPPDDDESTVWTDAGDNVEEVMDDEENGDVVDVVDMAHATFNGHNDSVYCIAIHPTIPGLVITGGGDDVAYIWTYDLKSVPSNPDEHAEIPNPILSIKELNGHTDTVTSVGFNFNGTLALTGSYDGTVKIWKVENGELQQTLEGPEDVEWAEWHSKGNAVIAGSKDGTVWMWLTATGACVQVFAGHDGPVSSGCFTKDGKLVCSGGEDGTVRTWLPKTGACKYTFRDTLGHEAMVTSMASSEDGDLLLTGSADGTMKLFQLSSNRLLTTFVHHDPTATGPAVADGAPTTVFTSLNTISENENEEEGDMDMSGEEGDATFAVECVGFARGGLKWVASGGMDKNLKVWDMTSGACRCVCAHSGSVVALRWHDSLPVVCTASLDNVIRLWDARSGALLTELTGHTDLVTNLDMISVKGAADAGNATDAIITVSDDKTSKVFLVDVNALLG